MFHDSLHRLDLNKKACLAILGFLFLMASAGWLPAELCHWWFSMEPVVVLLGGTAPLMATFWPWKPSYADRRQRGWNSVDYMRNGHLFMIGRGAMTFTLRFGKASGEKIYLLRNLPDIERLALPLDAGKIPDIRDASAIDLPNYACVGALR